MKLITKLVSGVLLGIGVPIVLLAAADLANPKSTTKDGAAVALCVLGLPPSALGGWLIVSGRRKQEQEERDRLQTTFFNLLKQSNGRITALNFAMATGLTGTMAKAYLEERAQEFSANFDVDDNGNMFYRFNLGGVSLPGSSSNAPPNVKPLQPIATEGNFNVILEAIPSVHKIAVLKGVRELTGLGLKEAKDLVEAAPTPLMTSVDEVFAQHCKQQLEAIGATVNIETAQAGVSFMQKQRLVGNLPLSAQGNFDVILEAVPGVHKITAIKLVREFTGLGLKETKELVEAAPAPLMVGVTEAIAQQCKKQLEAIGATVMVIEN